MNQDRLQSVLRAILFLGFVLFMVFGPFYRQVLLGESHIFRRWMMFHDRGVSIRDATFYLSDGESLVELDRKQVLDGVDLTAGEAADVWRINTVNEVRLVARLLCDELGDDADIRAVVRVGTMQGNGWQQDTNFNSDQNLCED